MSLRLKKSITVETKTPWEYDPGRKTLTLIYESVNPAELQNPDNVVIVPRTGDIFLQEDGDGERYVRGVTPDGEN